MPILYQLLKVIGLDIPHRYSEAIQEIKQKHLLQINLLEPSIAMETVSSHQSTYHRVVEFPTHNPSTELTWYDTHVTSKKESPLLPSKLYEGRLIRKKGEFWVVVNGTKRGFDSYDTFLQLGFYNELGFNLYASEIDKIPTGSTISKTDIKMVGTEQSIIKNYELLAYLKAARNKRSSTLGIPAESMESIRERQAKRLRMRNVTRSSYNKDKCERNETLETIVHTNGSLSILYLISHDNSSEHLAKKFAYCKESWIQPVRIQSTVFFESVMYRDYFAPYQKRMGLI